MRLAYLIPAKTFTLVFFIFLFLWSCELPKEDTPKPDDKPTTNSYPCRIKKQKDSQGNERHYEYDSNGILVKLLFKDSQNILTGQVIFEYNQQNKLIKITESIQNRLTTLILTHNDNGSIDYLKTQSNTIGIGSSGTSKGSLELNARKQIIKEKQLNNSIYDLEKRTEYDEKGNFTKQYHKSQNGQEWVQFEYVGYDDKRNYVAQDFGHMIYVSLIIGILSTQETCSVNNPFIFKHLFHTNIYFSNNLSYEYNAQGYVTKLNGGAYEYEYECQ